MRPPGTRRRQASSWLQLSYPRVSVQESVFETVHLPSPLPSPLPCRASRSPVWLTAEGRLPKLQGMTSGLPPSPACTGSSPCVRGMLVEMLLPGEWRELWFHVVSKLLFLIKNKMEYYERIALDLLWKHSIIFFRAATAGLLKKKKADFYLLFHTAWYFLFPQPISLGALFLLLYQCCCPLHPLSICNLSFYSVTNACFSFL